MTTPIPVPEGDRDRTKGAGAVPAPRDTLSSRVRRWRLGRYVGFVFVAPWVIAFLCFELIPTAAAFVFSLTDWSVVGEASFIGFANYEEMFFRDRLFEKSLYNTLYYALFAVPLGVVAGFLLALLLNTKVKGQTLFRTFFYLPALIPSVAGAIVWLWIFDTRNGARAGKFSHCDQEDLNDGVSAAVRKKMPAGGFIWDEAAAGGYAAALVSATLAYGALLEFGTTDELMPAAPVVAHATGGGYRSAPAGEADLMNMAF